MLDMNEIKSLSREFGFSIIEDAPHAIGSKYLGKYVSGCHYFDITIFSFHTVKIIIRVFVMAAILNLMCLQNEIQKLQDNVSRYSK